MDGIQGVKIVLLEVIVLKAGSDALRKNVRRSRLHAHLHFMDFLSRKYIVILTRVWKVSLRNGT